MVVCVFAYVGPCRVILAHPINSLVQTGLWLRLVVFSRFRNIEYLSFDQGYSRSGN